MVRPVWILTALLVVSALHGFAGAAAAKDEILHGYLMPFKCRNDDKTSHSRTCALRGECMITGYGLAVENDEFVQFDQESNRMAIRLLRRTAKETNLRAVAHGSRSGPLFHVTVLRLE
jgi:hypothetical protein